MILMIYKFISGYNIFEVLIMGRPSKPMPKNANSKYISRNNKQEIFSGLARSKKKAELNKQTTEENKPESDK